MKKLFFLFSFFIFIGLIYANTTLTIEVDKLSNAKLQYNFFDSNTTFNLNNISNINTTCKMQKNLFISKKGCILEYTDNSLIAKSEGKFSLDFKDLPDIKYTQITLILPENTKLENIKDIESLDFQNNKLILIWKNPTTNKKVFFKLQTNTTKVILAYLIIFLILFGLIGFLLILIRHQIKKRTQQNKIYQILSPTEQKIVDVLETKNTITQKQLAIETNIPKSTLSRWLKKLEEKHIIIMSDSTYYKKIKLSEWYLKEK